jgi:hypothetical protein
MWEKQKYYLSKNKSILLVNWQTNCTGLVGKIKIQYAIMSVYQNLASVASSVADPGCLSRIPDPGFYPSRISDPKTVTKESGEKKFVIVLFL